MRIRNVAARGFTLVELLTVIAIIALLVGILVPAIGAVRTRAKVTATRATISSLETGIEAFRGDQVLGGAYPPSASDLPRNPGSPTNPGNLVYQVRHPYGQLRNYPTVPLIEISGAGLLVWALAGADMLGSAGFRPYRSSSSYWAQDTDDRDVNGEGAYMLSSSGKPSRNRVGPLVDVSKMKITRWIAESDSSDGLGSFEIPDEVETAKKLGARPPRRHYPMFLDSFGRPFLYWRADSAGERCADNIPSTLASADRRGKYHFRDNGTLLDGTNTLLTNLRISTNGRHRLFFGSRDQNTIPMPPNLPPGPAIDPYQDAFATYLRNSAVSARIEPQKADSFIIISAGEDGEFGTGDDVANFDHNGAELRDQ